ncbi:hypothetical protein E8E12_008595 [Didymella heteroderae]|uniref:Uncharacterized protein n=1 Tax=Didymella heteroderae TaxID=1769908 RepID=A0A9P4WZI1_9PLEO|nr:hypothetical protein E8E12_008595 [Didymella heteroderae]
MPGQCTARLGSCSSQARALSTARRQSHVKHVTPLKGDDLGPTTPKAHRTFIRRKDGKKDLPLPPLLDPVVLAQRSQHEGKKEQPKFADFTPFQRKLWENPFAHALASPVRECRYTSTFQPSALLTTLHIRPHPTTSDPWLLPVSLTTTSTQLGLPFRFLSRQLIAAQLGKKKAWEKSLYPRMFERLSGGEAARLVWREDMPSLVLDLMRARLVSALSWNFSFRGRLIPVSSPLAEHVEGVEDVSSVLYFGSLRSRADEAQEECESITAELEKWSHYFGQSFGKHFDPHAKDGVTHKAPYWYQAPLVPRMQPRLQFPELEYRTTTWRGQRVPVYSLVDLLGEDKARELILGPKSKYAEHGCVVMKRARHNVPVETLLMHTFALDE